METMKAVYRILETLDKALDEEDFDFNLVKYESIGINEHNWSRLINILQNKGLIEGFEEVHFAGTIFPGYKMISPTITFEGIAYLAENSNTAKVVNAAKLLKNIIPGI